jgi:hypothetical protein
MVADHQGGRHQRPIALIGLAAGKVCVVASRQGDFEYTWFRCSPVWSIPPIFLLGKSAGHRTRAGE